MKSVFNYTLLHDAALYNSTYLRVLLRFAPHLLDVGDDVFNNNPLMDAVRRDTKDTAKMLLRAGADVRTKDKYGQTVFDFARDNDEMLEMLKQHQQVSEIFYFF